MTENASVTGFLVKAGTVPGTAALGADATDVSAEEIFAPPAERGADAPPRWYRVRADGVLAADKLEPASAWQHCHDMVARGEVDFAEPDLEQPWIWDGLRAHPFAAADCAAEDAPDKYGNEAFTGGELLWYRSDEFGQYDTALADVSADPARPVRVAHLDTGYDPDHATRPTGLREDLQRNFVEGEPADDARDRDEGVATQVGHGAATMAILAGQSVGGGTPIGVAPFAEVVPLRVSSRVVLLKTSAFVAALQHIRTLNKDPDTRIHIATMSMGGVASRAWAEAVNALYEAGVLMVSAAGNNFGNLPTRYLVFPARFDRVVAATGVMASTRPYADLSVRLMAGNYGPEGAMESALTAYTPNMPWVRYGCPTVVDKSGGGTSSATPQIAGTAALWIAKHRDAYEAYAEPWQQVEAVRHALFASAHMPRPRDDKKYWGNGIIRAADALAVAPAEAGTLTKTDAANGWFPYWRVITGFGADDDRHNEMAALEAAQLAATPAIEELRQDLRRRGQPNAAEAEAMREALARHPMASDALRERLGVAPRRSVRIIGPDNRPPPADTAVDRQHRALALAGTPVPRPRHRRLRVYAFDPSMEARLATFHLTEATVEVPWEDDLQPGPVGEYLEVVDVDPLSDALYAPVDLDDPHLVAENGFQPSEANPQFHQQMVYAVAMRTIDNFERALGRVALWSPLPAEGGPRRRFVRRLRIYPHALRQLNAYYSRDRRALTFGYVWNDREGAGSTNVPGSLIFTCLSHDVIAHETAHALLDGLHAHFAEPTNADVLAFHEGFADIVALLQHFQMPEALYDQIMRTGGDLFEESLLSKIAVQFGEAKGRGALRDAIGRFEDGMWHRTEPERTDYDNRDGAHARGALLVAAVFEAFAHIYDVATRATIDLVTNGTGVLPEGRIPERLARALSEEAARLAGQTLDICIRALDYCPPVDIDFGDYLRAVITADMDHNGDATRDFRVALVEAFRRRGIYPSGVASLSADAIAWEPPPVTLPLEEAAKLLDRLSLAWSRNSERATAFENSERDADEVQRWLASGSVGEEMLAVFGFYPTGTRLRVNGVTGTVQPLSVHSVRPAVRMGQGGAVTSDIVVSATQTWRADAPYGREFRGGSTVLIDPGTGDIRYLIRKRVAQPQRVERQMGFAAEIAASNRAAIYAAEPSRQWEPFAMLHHQAEREGRGCGNAHSSSPATPGRGRCRLIAARGPRRRRAHVPCWPRRHHACAAEARGPPVQRPHRVPRGRGRRRPPPCESHRGRCGGAVRGHAGPRLRDGGEAACTRR